MRKRDEMAEPDSCLNKARNDEILFVLRSDDPAAPATIRAWVELRVAMKMNNRGDAKILSALSDAVAMEVERAAIGPKK